MTRTKRIKVVRDMAQRIRYVCDTQSIYRFRDIESTIQKQERKHRKGYGASGYREPVAVAVDYFIVRCFADAFRVVRDTETARDVLDNLGVRLDYLMAISVVAQYEAEITSSIHVGDLMEAADTLDYSDDIARR